MPANIKRLVYFEKFMHSVAADILGRREDIDLVRLEYAGPSAHNEEMIAGMHGYQIQPRTELREPYFGDPALIARAPRLLAIASSGAGFDMVDVDACTDAGIIVVNQSGTNKEAVAEHALGMMIALSKKIAQADKALRRTWNLERYDYVGNDIRGKTVGIVGIGQIGTRTAELCRILFGMRVLAYDPYLDAAEIRARGAEKVELDALLAGSDYVSVHCPRTAETLGMFSDAQFALMKPTAYFVNTARGGIHDEEALARALAAGELAGAGVDVWFKEPPPPDHPLMAFENVLATPHHAGMTHEALYDMAEATALQWIDIFEGKRPPRLVNAEAWDKYRGRFERILGFTPEA